MADRQETPNERARARSRHWCCSDMWTRMRGSRVGRRLRAIVWAALFLWAGTVWLADSVGIMDRLTEQAAAAGWHIPAEADGWTVFFLGAGIILLTEIVLRMLVPAFGRPEACTWFGLVIFLGLAVGSWVLFWPLVLLGVGVAILLGAFVRSRPATGRC